MRKKCTSLGKQKSSTTAEKQQTSETHSNLVTSTLQGHHLEECQQKTVNDLASFNEEEMLKEHDKSCKAMAMDTSSSQPLAYDYHVVYSESYAVPVLYFNVSTSDGQRLTLDEVWSQVCPDSFQPYLNDNKWTTLTQQEHPLLGRPFLMLHPCHTADLMKQVLKDSQAQGKINYLTTWLSTVGPLVLLEISMEYVAM